MSFPAYENYKESGGEWLGRVPSHWAVTSFKRISSLEMGQSPSSEDCNQEGTGLPFLQGCAEFGTSHPTPKQYCEVPPKTCLAGDLLISVRAPVGAINIADQPYGIGRGLCAIRASRLDRDFLKYAVISQVDQLTSVATGSTYLAVTVADVGDTKLVAPPVAEQRAIAAFLDRETAKIDTLVEAQERLVALLKEKRQAVISHAVTKGLDPSAPMKDSGVEWLGQVPAHWEVVPLKRYLSVLSGYAFPSTGFTDDPTEVPLLRGVNVGVSRIRWDDVVYWQRSEGDGLEGWRLAAGDLVIGMDRPWIAEGLRLAEVTDEDIPCLLLQRVAALRPSHGLTSDYLKLTLQGEAFYHHCVPEMTGVSVPHISPGQIHEFMVAIPPVDEQMRISTLLRSAAKDAGALVAAGEQAISLLQERRAALISAAVTGKIDVRSLVKTAEAA